MKKFFLSALLAVAVAASAFSADLNADGKKVNLRVLQSFNQEFKNANDVQWTLKSNFAKATFTVDDEKVEAFYDLNGEAIGTSKAATVNDMPANVKKVLAKRYAGYTINETIKFDAVEESGWYIALSNPSKSVILKVGADGDVSVFRSNKKS